MFRYRALLIVAGTLFSLTATAVGQSPADGWSARLVGKALYLRGFWTADRLDFDGSGKLLNPSPIGPVTLSGVDVSRVEIKGQSLIVQGSRVALVAPGDGRQGLERVAISSTTRIWPSLRAGDKNKYHAAEEITITIGPGLNSGDFEPAFSAIFAEGLAQLASNVPPYWQCYASAYFVPGVIANSADRDVAQCVNGPAGSGAPPAVAIAGSVIPPSIVTSTTPKFTLIARELQVNGVVVVHLRIGTDGIPVGLQVVRALGAGLDEEALQAASQYRFRPATKEGIAVPVNVNIEIHFQVHP